MINRTGNSIGGGAAGKAQTTMAYAINPPMTPTIANEPVRNAVACRARRGCGRRFNQISNGERRKVLLARALANNPDLLEVTEMLGDDEADEDVLEPT